MSDTSHVTDRDEDIEQLHERLDALPHLVEAKDQQVQHMADAQEQQGKAIEALIGALDALLKERTNDDNTN